MADISTITLPGSSTQHTIKDATARDHVIWYGTCDTAAGTAAKVTNNITGLTATSYYTGMCVRIRFTYNNTASNPTLCVKNSSGTALKVGTSTTTNIEIERGNSDGGGWLGGEIVDFVYDGANFQIATNARSPINHASTATTYGTGTGSNYGHVKLSDSVSTTSAASEGVAATPTAVKTAYNLASTAKNLAETWGVEYIVGTQTAATNAWTGVTTATSLEAGKTIAYYLPYAGTSTAATLNLTLANGTATGAKPITWNGDSAVTTHYAAKSVLLMTYDGGTWRMADYNYDSNTLQRTFRSSSNVELPIAGISTANSVNAAYSEISSGSYKNVYAAIPDANAATINPSTGAITVPGGIVGNASTATKLGTSTVGGTGRPIYLNAGTPTAITALSTAYGGTGNTSVDTTPTSGSTKMVTSGGVYTALAGKAPTNHASTATTYGIGTSSNYGHVKLSDSVSTTSAASAGVAATPTAVKTAYDLAYSRSTVPTNHASTATTYGIGTNANYGHVQLSDSITTLSGQTAGIAATPTAVHLTHSVARASAQGRNLSQGTSGSYTITPAGTATYGSPYGIYPVSDYGRSLITSIPDPTAIFTMFTVSYDYSYTDADTATTIRCVLKDASGSYNLASNANVTIQVGSGSGHAEGMFLMTDGGRTYGTSWLFGNFGSGNRNIKFTVSNFKFEYGSTATTWTAAPEDGGIEYVVGTQTAATNAWTGKTSSSVLYLGKKIAYYLPYAGTSTAATLNLTLANGSSTTGAKTIRLNAGTNVTTHYGAGAVIMMVYDGTYWKITEYNSDTYNRVRHQNVITASAAITAGRIICGNASGYRNIAASVSFDIAYPLMYAGTTLAAAATGDNNYLKINSITASSNGSITSGTIGKMLWLKGTLSGTTFTILSSGFLTTVTPTAAESSQYYYIPLGIMYSTTQIYFNPQMTPYTFQNGEFTQAVKSVATFG